MMVMMMNDDDDDDDYDDDDNDDMYDVVLYDFSYIYICIYTSFFNQLHHSSYLLLS